MYGTGGFNGYRLIADKKLSKDTMLTLAYGFYKKNDNTDKTATKATAEVIVNL
jgi:hypothetical protein